MAELSAIERSLRDLGPFVEFPPTPDLASAVRRQIQPEPVRLRWQWRWALAAAAAVVLALGGVLAISPSARETLAGWLGIPGVRIEHTQQAPTPSPLPSGGFGEKLSLGQRSALAGVKSSSPALVRVPSRLGPPDEVYTTTTGGRRVVSFVYLPRAALPADPSTGVGALIVEFDGGTGSDVFVKGLPPGTTLERVQVQGANGYWISGATHALLISGPNGPDQVRLAGNVLLWSKDGNTYRIEANVSKEEAIAIAQSMG